MLKEIEGFADDFFYKLGIDINSLNVILEAEDIFFVKIDTPDSGLLIGTHGSNFEAIQGIFRNIFSNKYDKKIKLHLEINDYIHNKDAKLFSFIEKKITQVKQYGNDIKLPFLNPYERKKVHSYIHSLNDENIQSKSKGEGKDRRMFIIFLGEKQKGNLETKHSKLEIDIDGEDI